MATLVLSTVGTALGGPIGGAIGSLIGQSIDQQLFVPGTRKGPRLGDLSVQSSSYGTAIPRIYGRMRVAGSVIWATDLKESSELQAGAKGQPETKVYSYSVSLAIALSSRPVRSIGRIWADGKLLRGAADDFKVKTKFRLYPGSEEQERDPLVASKEGIDSTPAYRGLALAVFEDLELAEFGNRIPFLTFEIVADETPPTIGGILTDASDNAIDCAHATPVEGFAAYGSSVRYPLEQLVRRFGVDLFDDGSAVRSAAADVVEPADEDLGCSAEGEQRPKVIRSRTPSGELPARVRISYYDPDRDFQTGQASALIGRADGPEEAVELPAVLPSGAAKALANATLARRWAERETAEVRLPPTFLGLEPGTRLLLPGSERGWVAEQVTLDGLAVAARLRARATDVANVPADPGTSVPPPDVVASPTQLALLDLPDLGLGRTDVPVLQLAGANASAGWKPVALEVLNLDSITSSRTAFSETVLGQATTVLASGQAMLIDTLATVDVELVDADHWLESRDDDALVQGANLAAVGRELIQFGVAIPVGPKRFRLERLLRGRRGTEWAITGHQPGESFVMLDPARLRSIELRREALGSPVGVTAFGVADGAGVQTSAIANGEAMRPPSPVRLVATARGGGELVLQWIRRSRAGWAWLDQMDAPIGESSERYRVRIEGADSSLEFETVEPRLSLAPEQLQPLGPGMAAVSVVQIGDHAVSRPATLNIAI